MGTLSKRPLRDFGVDIRDRVEGFKSSIGSRLDAMHAELESPRGALGRVVSKLSRVPAPTWFALGGASLLGSIALKIAGKSHASMFVGQWAPTLLILGLYNKSLAGGGRDRAHLS